MRSCCYVLRGVVNNVLNGVVVMIEAGWSPWPFRVVVVAVGPESCVLSSLVPWSSSTCPRCHASYDPRWRAVLSLCVCCVLVSTFHVYVPVWRL